MSEDRQLKAPKACIIAAPRSGSGKTTITLGIMKLLSDKGFTVQPFKVGPDYLDPLWHQRAANNPSYNLDTWMASPGMLRVHFSEKIKGKDYGIIEGVMGLYDGFESRLEGSTAHCAMTLDVPVILVVDCKGMSGSVAPLLLGFENFNHDCIISGVILNNIGSQRHEQYCRDALAECHATIIGVVYRDESLQLSHRHLGLERPINNEEITKKLEKFCSVVEEHMDLQLLDDAMDEIKGGVTVPVRRNSSDTIRLAVAYDEAFHFYYQSNFDLLKAAGAELTFFSPLSDSKLPDNIHGLYLGGGYPELYAQQLSNNFGMRQQIRDFAEKEGIILAECGGFMYLGASLHKNEQTWPMCTVFDTEFIMHESKRKKLGYREIELSEDSILGSSGTIIRGHEFHYSHCINENKCSYLKPFKVKSRHGRESYSSGCIYKHTVGSYLHLYFLSQPKVPEMIVEVCKVFKQKGFKGS